MVPADLRYTKDHEWVRLEGDVATIGVTDFAANQLGDVVFVDLPATGRSVEQFSTFVVVESVKAVSDLYAPVSGEVTEVNEALASKPELVNSEPDRKSTRLNSSHGYISYAVFCLKKKKKHN